MKGMRSAITIETWGKVHPWVQSYGRERWIYMWLPPRQFSRITTTLGRRSKTTDVDRTGTHTSVELPYLGYPDELAVIRHDGDGPAQVTGC